MALLLGDAFGNNLDGGADDDAILGYGGADVLDGADGNDGINGGYGNDALYGGNGNDGLDGGDGTDFLYGGSGKDTLDGAAGNDWLFGGNGSDRMEGYVGTDRLFGGGSNDRLDGGEGSDTLSGGAGTDVLDGNGGVVAIDLLAGDVFDFDDASHTAAGAGRDVIVQFDDRFAGIQDVIDLADIDANTAVAGNQAFSSTFIGSAFTAAAQIRIIANPANPTQWIIQMNTDSDTAAEAEILVQSGGNRLDFSDFVL